MQVILAPMQGVVDEQMRDLLTSVGGYDRCVTEFVRVTNHRVPEKVFLRYCPELLNHGRTKAGTPVYIQLLGADAEAMGASAACAASLGARGIDINFGCPAKIVNRHGGGSVLLKTPDLVGDIVAAVRGAVPQDVPVTAKIRLGYDDDHSLLQIVNNIAQAGASELCIHARTRIQGYKPPAHWASLERIGTHPLPIFVNGEIWTPENALTACTESGCSQVMLGRGAIACPDLGLRIKAYGDGSVPMSHEPLAWREVAHLVYQQFVDTPVHRAKYVGNRTKQWLAYLSRQYPEAMVLFGQIKRSKSSEEISALIRLSGSFDRLSDSCPNRFNQLGTA